MRLVFSSLTSIKALTTQASEERSNFLHLPFILHVAVDAAQVSFTIYLTVALNILFLMNTKAFESAEGRS